MQREERPGERNGDVEDERKKRERRERRQKVIRTTHGRVVGCTSYFKRYFHEMGRPLVYFSLRGRRRSYLRTTPAIMHVSTDRLASLTFGHFGYTVTSATESGKRAAWRKACHPPFVARQFSPLYSYPRDFRLHRSASIHPRNQPDMLRHLSFSC